MKPEDPPPVSWLAHAWSELAVLEQRQARRSGPLANAWAALERMEARNGPADPPPADVWDELARSRVKLRAAIDGLSPEQPRLRLIQGGKA